LYFENFNIKDISTDIGKGFIENLSHLLECLNPPLVDKEKIEIRRSLVNNEEYIKVYIPHKTKRVFDLLIEHDELESTVKLADANFHFQEYEDDNERIEDVINLVSKIMQSTIQIHTFYKGGKIIIRSPYLVSNDGKKEPFQTSFHNLLTLINPFLMIRKAVERDSFFYK
jgi:hypothetical protein